MERRALDARNRPRPADKQQIRQELRPRSASLYVGRGIRSHANAAHCPLPAGSRCGAGMNFQGQPSPSGGVFPPPNRRQGLFTAVAAILFGASVFLSFLRSITKARRARCSPPHSCSLRLSSLGSSRRFLDMQRRIGVNVRRMWVRTCLSWLRNLQARLMPHWSAVGPLSPNFRLKSHVTHCKLSRHHHKLRPVALFLRTTSLAYANLSQSPSVNTAWKIHSEVERPGRRFRLNAVVRGRQETANSPCNCACH